MVRDVYCKNCEIKLGWMYVSVELTGVNFLVILAFREHNTLVLLQYSVPVVLYGLQSLVIWILKKAKSS